jgi:hypothetical protein
MVVGYNRVFMGPDDISEKKKIFSYAEALALMPEVQRLTDAAYQRIEALQTGITENPAPAMQDEMDRVVSEWAHAIMEHGIDVKGLWLVDFDNGSGYYCWRYPEQGLRFFHSYEDGFRGRVPIQ